GQNLLLRGRAINVDQKADYTWVNFDAYVQGRTTSDQLVVEFRPKQTGILRDDCYLVYGVAAGTQSVQFVFTGASKEAAVVDGYAWDALPRGEFSACADPSPTPTPRPTATPVPTATPRPSPTVTAAGPRPS